MGKTSSINKPLCKTEGNGAFMILRTAVDLGGTGGKRILPMEHTRNHVDTSSNFSQTFKGHLEEYSTYQPLEIEDRTAVLFWSRIGQRAEACMETLKY